jgi:DNA-binding phage protein
MVSATVVSLLRYQRNRNRESAMKVLPFKQPGRVAGQQYDFETAAELVAFVGDEIIASGKHFSIIARNADVCQSTVAKLAKHQTRFPRVGTCLQILKALGFEVVVRR